MAEEKNKGGRPLKFKSVEQLQEKIEAYFISCWRQKIDMYGNPVFAKDSNGKKTTEPIMEQFKPYTITGLAVALDTNRQTLLEYEGEVEGRDNKDPKFADTIKNAKEKCHAYAEESLFIGKNPAGAIFNLKNNYHWKDQKELDHTSKGEKLNVLSVSYEDTKDEE